MGKELLTLEQMFQPGFRKALRECCFLRAQTGGGLSRLNFAAESPWLLKKPTCEQRLDVLKMWILPQKQQTYRSTTILMQASAAMVAQANTHERCSVDVASLIQPPE